ncbi:DoxX family protein [Flavobacterium soli]|uniref:DoxX family protein n=1 Tax=Flavobacterium soli TaxID=344881 RepID=UPI00055888D4|nr:DoxX family membrane protein [Flavobacterium soli]
MAFNFPWHLYLMALLYVLAGINHFLRPRMYVKIIPPSFPKPELLNKITGTVEILLGILLCFPYFSKFAAIGIIALLIAVFPANLYMYQNPKASFGLPKYLLLLRLPLQALLMIWACLYIR